VKARCTDGSAAEATRIDGVRYSKDRHTNTVIRYEIIIVIVNSRFLERPQKQSRENQLIQGT